MGGLFGGKSTISTTAEKVAGIQVQTSAYGIVIPVVFGKNRLPAQLLYFTDFTAIPHTTTTTSGGKGGGVKQVNTTFTYTGCVMMAVSAGPITSWGRMWADKDVYSAAQWTSYTRANGAYGQAVWTFLTTNHPTEADPYSGVSYIAKSKYDMGESGTLKNHSFEIVGFNPVNAGVNDNASPADIIKEMLTNQFEGINFPSAYLASLTNTSDFYKYTAAQGLLFSPAYTQQSPTREWLTKLLEACNANFVWSDGILKVIPYADSNVSGSSTGTLYSYIANTTPVYNLTDDDYMPALGEDPVRCIRKRTADAWNQVQIEFMDAALDYNTNVAEAKDLANIELYGLRTGDPIAMHFITDATTAQIVAQLILQRKLYIRNIYEFTLGWRYCLLEPMDLVTLTDANLGLAQKTVRLISWEETDEGHLKFTAEEWPFGVATPALYGVSTGAGYAPDTQVLPGSVNVPVILEPPLGMTAGEPQVWIGASSTNDNWGGALVWVSRDGTTYEQVGVIYKGFRDGYVLAGWTGTGALKVHMTQSKGELVSASATDAAAFVAPIYCNGEVMSFSTATLTGSYDYDLTIVNRGGYGTPQTNKTTSHQVCRLDETLCKLPTPQGCLGGVMRVKLQSFNLYGQQFEDLAGVTAYSYTIAGGATGTNNIPAPTNVTIASSTSRPA